MLPLKAFRATAAAMIAAATLACGLGAAHAQDRLPAGVQAPTQEDSIILQLQVKKYRLRNEVRGYQTGSGGACVDLGDVILALDLPIRLDRKSRRATGWIFREDQTFAL